MKSFVLFGERCSGTNWIAHLIRDNFALEPVIQPNNLPHKQLMVDYDELLAKFSSRELDDHLFMVVVRDPYDWVRSLYAVPHHIPEAADKTFSELLRMPVNYYAGPHWQRTYSANDEVQRIKQRSFCKFGYPSIAS